MEKKAAAVQDNRDIEDFEPSTTWARADEFDTLVVHLPGYRKENLKVQITSSNKLKISGERPLGTNKWSRFRKEFVIPSNYDANEITARFEDQTLFVKHPKIITAADDQQRPEAKAPTQVAQEPHKQESDNSSKAEKRGHEDPRTAGNHYNGSQKTGQEVATPKTGVETKPSSGAGGEMANTSADDDARGTASGTSSGKKSTEDLAEERKSTSVATIEKDKNLNEAAKATKEADESSRDKFRVEDLKQALAGVAIKMKQRRELTKMILAVLLVLVAGLYARNAIMSIGKSNN